MSQTENRSYQEYQAKYTALGNYQPAHQQVYAVQAVPGGCILRVEARTDTQHSWQSCMTTLPYREACRVMRFLYENRAQPENWCDILTDLCIATFNIQSGKSTTAENNG